MKIATLAIVVGNKACNAACPCCVAKMTPDIGLKDKPKEVNWRNLRIACRLSRCSGVTTAMITGKGEPTLYPTVITNTVRELRDEGFPLIEMQTNGIIFNRVLQGDRAWKNHLKNWRDLGMTLICLSVMHPDGIANRHLMRVNEVYDYWEIADMLHTLGFSVRINVTLTKKFMLPMTGLIPEDPEKMYEQTCEQFQRMVIRCESQKVEQLTVRDVGMPPDCENEICDWVRANQYDANAMIERYLREKGAVKLLRLAHGATVYDYLGQNVCTNNCLTESEDPDDMRQLIFTPDGGLFYSWQYKGARIL